LNKKIFFLQTTALSLTLLNFSLYLVNFIYL
jgi:hypothetical protein